jgi:hypothetical protein
MERGAMGVTGIQGNLETMPLSDVLQWLAQGNKTGVLQIRSARGITKKVYFLRGRVLSSASSDPREYLGQFLISRGLLTEEQLNMAMETQLQTGIKLGKILVTVGILDEDDLKAMLRLKAEETLYDLFLWDEGEFSFEELQSAGDDLIPIELDVTSLVMEGMRRVDEWRRIRKVIASNRVVLGRTNKMLRDSTLEPDSALLRVYEALNGERTIEEAALELHATEFHVSSMAFKLIEAGLLEARFEKPRPDEAAYGAVQERVVAEAETLLAEGREAEALNLLGYGARKEPKNAKIRALIERAETSYQERFIADTLPLESVLELKVPLERLPSFNLTPQEGFIATRVNGMWDLASILKVCPLPRTEALRAVKKLLDLEVLRVREK